MDIQETYRRFRRKERRFAKGRIRRNSCSTPLDILYLVEECCDYFKMLYEEYKDTNSEK